MSSHRSARKLVVAVLLGVLVGGGLLAVTPAGAEVSTAAATNWKKIWNKKLKPLAVKSFYTKTQSDAKYQPKGSYETAGSGYSKAETYSKTESDAKYVGATRTLRGTFSMMESGEIGDYVSTEIEFGLTLSAAPTPHFIDSGDPVPAGCSGTPAAPDADPGHLCIFAFGNSGLNTIQVKNATNTNGSASPFGAILYSTTSVNTNSYAYGSWAVEPLALSSSRPKAPRIAKSTNPAR